MGEPVSISIANVTKRFGSFTAVDQVSLDIAQGEFFSLLGPSGCGKTTLLRMIAGFEQPTSGSLRIAGRDATSLPPHRRPVNMVFQHYALFPHLTVEKNIAFGLRYRRELAKRDHAARVTQALELVRLHGLHSRYPHELSGGQRQRVALARALALQPAVLLLDEPLGALDQKLRKEMQVELKGLQKQLGITFVFVTHDQEEALTMSDRVAVMNAGRVEQAGPAREVFETPRTPFVAQFMGADNFLRATVTQRTAGEVHLRGRAGFELTAPQPSSLAFSPGQEITLLVRPEKLRLSRGDMPTAGVALDVTLVQRVYQGASTLWTVRTTAGEMLTIFEQNAHSDTSLDPAIGNATRIWFDPRHTMLMADSPPEARP